MGVGQHAKTLRLERGLTQKQVADALGVDHSYISRLENEERNARVDHLEKLAEFFGVEVGVFFRTNGGQ